MNGDVLGGGIVVAVAAALWMAYLVPSWLRGRQYLATERNAVRLQQTLRILAETAEVPEEVRVEATAREVAAQRRVLKGVQRRADEQATARAAAEARLREAELEADKAQIDEMERKAVEARERARRAREAAAESSARVSRGRRLRRVRAVTTLFAFAGLVALVAGMVTFVVSGGWFIAAGGVLLLGVAVGVLTRLAHVGRAQAARPAAARQTQAAVVHEFEFAEVVESVEVEEVVPEPEVRWTPRRLPQPLHLKPGTVAASTMASIDAAASLRESTLRERRDPVEAAPVAAPAAAVAELPVQEERAPVTHIRPLAVPPAPAAEPETPAARSRFAAMGVVGDIDDVLDVDAVLRLRRAAG
jgi:hypothetical protein